MSHTFKSGLPGVASDRDYYDFSILQGQIIRKILGGVDDSELSFVTLTGRIYTLFHDQNCCESVFIQDICGDLDDLLNVPILLAERSTNEGDLQNDIVDILSYQPESYTWTFYKLATVKGAVTIRWLGTSNGFYSEEVDFEEFIIDFNQAHNYKKRLLEFYTEEEIGMILLNNI